MCLITRIWGRLGLSDEEKAKTQALERSALEQRTRAVELSHEVTEINERNGFGWKFNAALRGGPL